MYFIIFCAIFCFPTTLAFQVSFHTGNPRETVYLPECTPLTFIYQRSDNFTMYLRKLYKTSTMTGYHTFIKTCTGIKGCRSHYNPGSKIKLQTEQITIDVELLTEDGCLRQTILKGREIPANASTKGHTFNDFCINGNECTVIVDETKECPERMELHPQPCAETSYRTPRSSTIEPWDKHFESLNETDTLKLLDILTVFAAIKILNSLESPTRNISITSSSTGAEPSYFTVMIITSITAAVALTLLLVIAYRRFCRKTYNSPGLPQNPANENRYYENMLFRDECQQQIEQLEQRALEDPQPSDSSEQQYEEINNHSNRW